MSDGGPITDLPGPPLFGEKDNFRNKSVESYDMAGVGMSPGRDKLDKLVKRVFLRKCMHQRPGYIKNEDLRTPD